MHNITQVQVMEGYRISLTFADGTAGIVDLSELAGHGVFALWNDYREFRKARIGDTGELVWPGDVDLCPDTLYMKATGKRPDEVFPNLRREFAHA